MEQPWTDNLWLLPKIAQRYTYLGTLVGWEGLVDHEEVAQTWEKWGCGSLQKLFAAPIFSPPLSARCNPRTQVSIRWFAA